MKTTTDKRGLQGRRVSRRLPVGAVTQALEMQAATRGRRVIPIAATAFATPDSDAVGLTSYRIPQKTHAFKIVR